MSLLGTYRSLKATHWLILLAFWSFMAAIISSQLYFNGIKNGISSNWLALVAVQLPIWWMWAAVSPVFVYIANKYPIGRERWLMVPVKYLGIGALLLLFLSNATLVYMFMVYGYLDIWDTTIEAYAPYFFSRYSNDFLIYSLVMMIVVVIRTYSVRKNDELNMALMQLKNDQLKNQLTKSQLQALKLQLNPHFLFNTLNTISSLTLTGAHTNSINVTTKLGDFLRRTLDYEEHQLVDLKKELEFFELYLDIESIRFKDKLVLKKHVDAVCLSASVPNLILQPLIENAIKFGISRSREARLIELNILRENGYLNIELFNEGPFLNDRNSSEGVGLRNVRSRLQKLYGDDHEFTVQNHPNRQGVRSAIRFPWNQRVSEYA